MARGRSSVTLGERDAAVVELVGRFRLFSAGGFGGILFSENKSHTPQDRVLKRLTDARYLARLGRVVGGYGGKSEGFVYQLGPVGWRYLGKGGSYRPLRVIDYHALTIADCFVMLKALERGGELTVISYEADPASRLTVGQILLTPDAYVELGVQALKRKFSLWLEVDRATENAEVIMGKCSRYWRAFQSWDGDVFPYIVFVVPDATRKREIERVIAGGPEEAHALFQVCELGAFGGHIMSVLR
jgi:hypothetical protein